MIFINWVSNSRRVHQHSSSRNETALVNAEPDLKKTGATLAQQKFP
jgi:hypothetical protein